MSMVDFVVIGFGSFVLMVAVGRNFGRKPALKAERSPASRGLNLTAESWTMMREATKGALVATSGPGRNDSLPLPLQGWRPMLRVANRAALSVALSPVAPSIPG